MEFTIQDKIDIYHVILGMIEAEIHADGYNKYSVCDEIFSATLELSTYNHRFHYQEIFSEWWEFYPGSLDINPYAPWWWPHTPLGDHQRCEHIRKVLRSLYKQLP